MNSVKNIQAKIPLDVAVIGGGICGLSIAIACARAGIKVSVYETMSTLTEVGAGIQVAPNMSRILRHWNLLDALLPQAVFLDGISVRRYVNDVELAHVRLNDIEAVHGAPNLLVHRADLHSILRMGAEKVGVKIYTSFLVEDIDFENTCIKIKDNPNWIQADAIIAADGIRKKMLAFHGQVDNVRESGDAAWRVVISAEQIYESKDIGLIEILERSSVMRWIGPNGHIICYPIRNNKFLCAVLTHTDKQGTEESWTKKGDKKEMLDFYKGWSASIQALLDKAFQKWAWSMDIQQQTLEKWNQLVKVVTSGESFELPYTTKDEKWNNKLKL